MIFSTRKPYHSVYVHIPFCEVKCGYCDFFSVPRGFEDFALQKEYVDALVAEIHTETSKRSAEFSLPVVSIFFGGGTPSLLEPELLERILNALVRHFSWNAATEITIETNPKTVSREKLKAFRSLGVNRISIGVQSFNDRFLKSLGRIHEHVRYGQLNGFRIACGDNTLPFQAAHEGATKHLGYFPGGQHPILNLQAAIDHVSGIVKKRRQVVIPAPVVTDVQYIVCAGFDFVPNNQISWLDVFPKYARVLKSK